MLRAGPAGWRHRRSRSASICRAIPCPGLVSRPTKASRGDRAPWCERPSGTISVQPMQSVPPSPGMNADLDEGGRWNLLRTLRQRGAVHYQGVELQTRLAVREPASAPLPFWAKRSSSMDSPAAYPGDEHARCIESSQPAAEVIPHKRLRKRSTSATRPPGNRSSAQPGWHHLHCPDGAWPRG